MNSLRVSIPLFLSLLLPIAVHGMTPIPNVQSSGLSNGFGYSCGSASVKYAHGVAHQTDWIVTPDGLNRTFNIFIPTSYTNSLSQALYPMTFVLHGGGGSATQAENGYGVDAEGQAQNFIIVYPDGTSFGTTQAWNAGNGCCGPAYNHQVDDVAFISTLIDYLTGIMCINPNAVFSSGMSNGAVMTHTLGCRLADKIAAIAPVEGTIFITDCAPSRPMPIMQVWGTLDQNFYWQGGISGCGVTGLYWFGHPYSMNNWLTHNQCGCTFPNTTTSPPFDASNPNCPQTNLTAVDGSDKTANVTRYGNCAGSAEVILSIAINNGHAWPGKGTGGTPGDTCSGAVGDYPISKKMLQFFTRHIRNSTSSSGSSSSSTGGAARSSSSTSTTTAASGSASSSSTAGTAAPLSSASSSSSTGSSPASSTGGSSSDSSRQMKMSFGWIGLVMMSAILHLIR